MEFDLDNSIIIFDEAHNIEKIAEQGCSYQISTDDLKAAMLELIKHASFIEESEAKSLSLEGEKSSVIFKLSYFILIQLHFHLFFFLIFFLQDSFAL